MKRSKQCYLDTNVLVSYKLKPSPNHTKATSLLERLVQEEFRLYISSLTIDEFLYTLSRSYKPYKYELKQAILKVALMDILNLPSLQVVNPPTTKTTQLEVLSLVEKFKLHPRDAYHLLTAQENNIPYFATFDSDFKAVFKNKILLSPPL